MPPITDATNCSFAHPFKPCKIAILPCPIEKVILQNKSVIWSTLLYFLLHFPRGVIFLFQKSGHIFFFQGSPFPPLDPPKAILKSVLTLPLSPYPSFPLSFLPVCALLNPAAATERGVCMGNREEEAKKANHYQPIVPGMTSKFRLFCSSFPLSRLCKMPHELLFSLPLFLLPLFFFQIFFPSGKMSTTAAASHWVRPSDLLKQLWQLFLTYWGNPFLLTCRSSSSTRMAAASTRREAAIFKIANKHFLILPYIFYGNAWDVSTAHTKIGPFGGRRNLRHWWCSVVVCCCLKQEGKEMKMNEISGRIRRKQHRRRRKKIDTKAMLLVDPNLRIKKSTKLHQIHPKSTVTIGLWASVRSRKKRFYVVGGGRAFCGGLWGGLLPPKISNASRTHMFGEFFAVTHGDAKSAAQDVTPPEWERERELLLFYFGGKNESKGINFGGDSSQPLCFIIDWKTSRKKYFAFYEEFCRNWLLLLGVWWWHLLCGFSREILNKIWFCMETDFQVCRQRGDHFYIAKTHRSFSCPHPREKFPFCCTLQFCKEKEIFFHYPAKIFKVQRLF